MINTHELIDNLSALRLAIEHGDDDRKEEYKKTLLKQEKHIEDLLKTKVDNIDQYFLTLKKKREKVTAEIGVLAEEISRLKKKLRSLDNTEKHLKEYTIPGIIATIGKDDTLETSTARYTRYKRHNVNITDEGEIDKKYIKEKITKKIDKRKLNKVALEAMKNKQDLPAGCEIKSSWSLRRS